MEKYHKEAERQNDEHHVEAKQWAKGLEIHLKDLKVGVKEEAKAEVSS